MRQPDNTAQRRGQGVKRNAKQHPRENQEQCWGIVPGKQQQSGEAYDANAADRYRPSQIAAGLTTFVNRDCHASSFLRRFPTLLFRQFPAGIKLGMLMV